MVPGPKCRAYGCTSHEPFQEEEMKNDTRGLPWPTLRLRNSTHAKRYEEHNTRALPLPRWDRRLNESKPPSATKPRTPARDFQLRGQSPVPARATRTWTAGRPTRYPSRPKSRHPILNWGFQLINLRLPAWRAATRLSLLPLTCEKRGATPSPACWDGARGRAIFDLSAGT